MSIPKTTGTPEQQEMIPVLNEMVLKTELAPSQIGFAKSLLGQYEKYGLSDKQWAWVKKLSSPGTDEPVNKPTMKLDPTALRNMFISARKKGVKHPALEMTAFYDLLDKYGMTFKVTRSGETAKYPGTFYINALKHSQVNGKNTKMLGYVTPDGELHYLSGRIEKRYRDPVLHLIAELFENPKECVIDHGHKTGRCSFCFSKLTSKESLEVGYGPVCAERYSIPWGKKVAAHA